MKNKKTWYEIYLDEIKLKKDAKGYIKDKVKHKKIFLEMLEKYSKENKKLLEAGCGTGIISSYMANLGYDVIGVDIDENILELSKNLAKEYFNAEDKKIKFIKKSIFDLDYKEKEFDVVFSNGVVEHFEDEQIIETLKKQLYICKYLIVGIPTRFFDDNEALYGDERFLDLKKWRELFEKIDGKIIEEHSFHYMTFFEKLQSLRKIFRPKPFRVFVIERK